MEEKLGIENLKLALIAAITLAEKVEEKFADDGKISGLEALNVAVGSFGDVMRVIKSGTQIKGEYLDLDESERDELLSLVETELDLENDKIEVIVEKAIEFLFNLDELIQAIRK